MPARQAIGRATRNPALVVLQNICNCFTATNEKCGKYARNTRIFLQPVGECGSQMERERHFRAPAGGCLPVTRRESQVLGWIAAGKSDWAIGRILNISGKTVNFHVENAKRKFGVGTRVQAVVAALREGMIST